MGSCCSTNAESPSPPDRLEFELARPRILDSLHTVLSERNCGANGWIMLDRGDPDAHRYAQHGYSGCWLRVASARDDPSTCQSSNQRPSPRRWGEHWGQLAHAKAEGKATTGSRLCPLLGISGVRILCDHGCQLSSASLYRT